MKSKSLRPVFLAAAMLLPSLPAKATVASPLVMVTTLFLQVSEETEGNIFRGEVEAMRLNSKDLLGLFAQQTGMTFPRGARIIVDPDGDVRVTDRHGTLIVDVSAFAFADFGSSLFDGVFNIDTEQERSTIFIAFTLELDIPSEDLSLDLTGVAIEKFRANKPNDQGTQILRGKIAVDVTGQGSLDGGLILGEGNIDLTGKEVETKL